MNIKSIKLLLVILLSVTVLISCSNDDKKTNHPMTIAKIYSGNIQDVDKIELIDGTTGERQIITQDDEVANLINLIKDEKMIPSDNKDGAVGYIFRIKLFENEELILDFTRNRIKNVEYESNESLHQKLKEIYKEYFEREF